MILGTAGHIDHGKTALVRALTGVDTDRLPEERRRGITIELGFAPLTLPGVGTVGVVDVPGHEAFVRTMLAGAAGIDLALVVVAADEGVMPQTREHVAILDLLGVRSAIVALTKCDLVDAEWLALVDEDVRSLLDATGIAVSALIPTSVVTGEGIEPLRLAIADAARALPTRDRHDLFRLPVDRAFTVKGTGTVATGTVWSGELRRDAVVRILPAGLTARVRGVQAHGVTVDAALPGNRAAIALAGLDVADVPRGSVIVADEAWAATRVLRADVTLLGDAAAPLRPRTRIRFHIGTTEVGARIVAAGGPVEPGQVRPARVLLDEPVVARAGDRFVLRSASPLHTIGGGVVSDPAPPHRRARPWPDTSLAIAARLRLALAEAPHHGLEISRLAVRLGAAPAAVERLLANASGTIVRLGSRIYESAVLDALREQVVAEVAAHHAHSPLDGGTALQALRARLPGTPELIDAALRAAVEREEIEVEGGMARSRGWAPRLTPAQETLLARIESNLREAGAEPPSIGELAAVAQGADAIPSLVKMLERRGVLVQVESDRYYHASAVDALTRRLREGMERGRAYSPAELRDILGVSRKYLIPFLEFADRRGLTERTLTGRVLHGT